MKRLILIIFILTFLAPCMGLFSYTAFGQEKTAKVYIYRKQTIGSPNKPGITVNGMMIGQLPNKSYYECIVPAGDVQITMDFSMMGAEHAELNFFANEGEECYVKSSVNISGGSLNMNFSKGNKPDVSTGSKKDMGVSVTLYRVPENEGQKQVKKCKLKDVADMTQYAPSTQTYYADNVRESQPEQILPQAATQTKIKERTSDIDKDIPVTKDENGNTFVLIIANEDYAFVDNVEYALNDGRAFKEYCEKTLGVPERQIWHYENASLGILSSGVNKMVQAMRIFDNANAIVYYCGHGIPDEKTNEAYIIPVDGNGTDINSCYSLNKLYKTLGESNTAHVTYFLDACFTGANREGSMLVAARGVAREPKKETIQGNTVVFSAASADETAMPFKEKGHGLFTYFLLKKLQETKGNLTYGELADYITEKVKRESFLSNDKPQNPVVATSPNLSKDWKSMKLK